MNNRNRLVDHSFIIPDMMGS